MSDSSNSSSGGIGLGGCIFIVFLVLKLTDTDPVGSWSWWWVTSPLWLVAAIVIGFGALALCGAGVFAGIIGISDSVGRKKRMRDVMDD